MKHLKLKLDRQSDGWTYMHVPTENGLYNEYQFVSFHLIRLT